jgi:hypothetical protein
MSLNAAIALRKAILAQLFADTVLTTKLGGPKIWDEVPRGTEPPYVTFGDAQTRDWSTNSDNGAEHFVLLHCWSTARGMREALDIAARVQALLDEAVLTLDQHRLIDLRFVQQETKREQNGRFARVTLRFRATTEAL